MITDSVLISSFFRGWYLTFISGNSCPGGTWKVTQKLFGTSYDPNHQYTFFYWHNMMSLIMKNWFVDIRRFAEYLFDPFDHVVKKSICYLCWKNIIVMLDVEWVFGIYLITHGELLSLNSLKRMFGIAKLWTWSFF